ncbi:MAG TPA: serine hydrolase domain-containing protein, partial [Chitinophagaceae bacterium]|nr:serine hydrolase domain-containing protein [Chitinophagaceae bacterium]
MKKALLLLVIALYGTVAIAQTLTSKLDEFLSVLQRTNKFNGVALVAKDGKILLNKGYGWRDAHKRVLHDEHSIFQIGSITKQFTATVVLYLQEQGKLRVSDTIGKYVPGFPNGGRITIEHLLTHTSGIYSYTNDSRFMNVQAVKPIALDSLINIFRNKPLDFQPGAQYRYNNSGYILLGYIIQKVSGKPYEQMVRELIFRPAGMQHSGFDFKGLKAPERSTGYFALAYDTIRSTLVDSSVSYAAGSIYATAEDLYKWSKALLADKVIKRSSINKAFTPYKNNYGYGWAIDSLEGKRIIEHNGGIFGFTSDMLWVPADGVCIVLLSNKPEMLGPITKTLFRI